MTTGLRSPDSSAPLPRRKAGSKCFRHDAPVLPCQLGSQATARSPTRIRQVGRRSRAEGGIPVFQIIAQCCTWGRTLPAERRFSIGLFAACPLHSHITIDNGLVLPESSESKDIERKRKKPSRRRAYQQPCSWHCSEPPKLPGP